MRNILIKINSKWVVLFLLLLGSIAGNAQGSEFDDNFDFNGLNELDELGVPGYNPGDSDYYAFADFGNWGDYNGYTGNGHNDFDSGGSNSNSGNNDKGSGGSSGGGSNRVTTSEIVLTKKVQPGENHTQKIKVLRDSQSKIEVFVSQIVINGVVIGTVTFSNPQVENGAHLYTRLTVEIYSNSPIGVTSITSIQNDGNRDYDKISKGNTSNVNQVVMADLSNFKDIGVVEFYVPFNEDEDLVITGTTSTNRHSETKDPCVVAKELTALSNNQTYKKAVQDIKLAAADKLEHSITLGKNAAGEVTAAPMNNGTANSVKVNDTWERSFTVLHNHPSDTAPSSGDILTLTEYNIKNNNFNTIYAITQKEMYVIAVTNLEAAQIFSAKYLANLRPGIDGEYPDFMLKEMSKFFYNMDSYNFEAQAKAKAFVVNKYNGGITFFKQDNKGVFYPLTTKEVKQANGSKKYTLIPCT